MLTNYQPEVLEESELPARKHSRELDVTLNTEHDQGAGSVVNANPLVSPAIS